MVARHWLCRLREAKGLTRIDLASELGVSPAAIGMYERGIKSPDRDKVFILADLLGSEVLDRFAAEARQRHLESGRVA